MSKKTQKESTILEQVIILLGQQTDRNPSRWSARTELEKAGIDSFELIDFVFLLEEEFEIEIEYNHNEARRRFATIGDVARLVEQHRAANNNQAPLAFLKSEAA